MEKLLKLNYDADYFYGKAADLTDKGKSSEAIYYFYRALSLEPFNPWIMAEIGHCYYDMGVVRQALEWYHRALVYDKECDSACQGAANCFIALGRADIALDYLSRCSDVDLEDMLTDMETAATVDDGMFVEKKKRFEKLSVLRNEEYLNRAKLCLLANDLSTAEDWLKKIDENSKEFCESAYFLALIYCDSGRTDKALELSEKMKRICPNEGKTFVVCMAAYEKLGMNKERNEIIDYISKLQPSNYADALGIAICCSDLELYDIAAEFYEHCLSFQPYDKNSLVALALCYHNIGLNEKCKDLLIKASRLFPEDGVSKYYLRKTYEGEKEIINPLAAQVKDAPKEYFEQLTEDLRNLSIAEMEDKYDAEDSYYDSIASLFVSDRYDILLGFVVSVAPSERFRPLFRQLLTRPEVPFILKCECLTWLLFFEKEKEFALFEDGRMVYCKPTDIRLNNPIAKVVYWKTYSALRLLSVDFTEKDLKARVRLLLKRDENIFNDAASVNENVVCLASSLCGDVPFMELKQFCDLFEADSEKCVRIAQTWEVLQKND